MDRKIIDRVPHVLRDIREYRAFTAAEQPQFEKSWEALYFCLDETFIKTASEQSIARFERIMGVRPRSTDTLDDRRLALLAALANDTPYTFRWLKARLYILLGGDKVDLTLDHNAYHLGVRVALEAKRQYDIVLNLLKNILPANITLDASVDYRRYYMLRRFRYGELRPYTYDQIKRGLNIGGEN